MKLSAITAKLGNLGFGAFSRIFALGSQFVVLVLLGKLMPKADFGDFMIVYALTRVVSTGLGTGLATLLVYHISRNASEPTEHSLHRSVAALGLLVGGLAAAAMAVFAPVIAASFAKPMLVFWIRGLSTFTLFYTLLTVSAGVLDGRGKITKSIVATEFLPNLIRLLALPPLLLLGYGNISVVCVMIASVFLPWLALASTLLRGSHAGFARLTAWDLQYSGKLTLHSFAAMQMQGLDMLVVGWLFTSSAAADYAIASRVAALIPFLQQIIVKTFMARAGRAIHEADLTGLQAETDRSRYAAVMLVTATAVLALSAYPVLMLVMGKFGGSMPLLAVLAVASVIRAYYPGADALLRVAGYADFSLFIMLISGGLIVVCPLLLGHWTGVMSVALGSFLSAIVLNPLIGRFLRGRINIRLTSEITWPSIGIALVGTAIAYWNSSIVGWIVGVAILAASALPTHLNQRASRSKIVG